MASSFSFGFCGDDIEESGDLVDDMDADIQGLGLGGDVPQLQQKEEVDEELEEGKPARNEPRLYTLDELVRCLSFSI